MRYSKGSLFILIMVLSLNLGGCPWLSPRAGYAVRVTAHIPPQPVDSLRMAWLGLGGFEGPRQMRGTDPNCSYYLKRLPLSGVVASAYDCYGPTDDSMTGWGYKVSVSVMAHEDRPEVRAEIEALGEEIRKAIQAQVGDARVTKKSGPIFLPMI